MTRKWCSLRPRLCSAPVRKSYALRCVRGTKRERSTLVAIQLRDVRALLGGQQAGLGVEIELGAAIGDVEIAHGELADAIPRRERRILDLLHAQPLRPIGQVGALGVEDRVIV